MHPYFESLAVIGAPSLQASLMAIHHYTSLRSILEDDSISLTSKATFETSCMPSFERVGTLYGNSGGTPLYQNFIMSQSLHDLKGSSVHCRCGGY
jgi:hypothetical protein